MKLFFFDVETTGLSPIENAIHQISGEIVIDGVTKESFDYKVRPHEGAKIEPEAVAVAGVTKEQIMAYPPMGEVYSQLVAILAKHVDKYSKTDKYFLVGYNNASFDNQFLREFFTRNSDKYFGSWFWSNSLDVMIMASQDLMERRGGMVNFKLMTVAKEYGIEVSDAKLHDAGYDLFLTKSIYDLIIKNKPMSSNVNDWVFSKHLDQFKVRMLDPQIKRVEEAKAIMDNKDYPWKDEEAKTSGQAKYDNYKSWLSFYQEFYDQGMVLVQQHENLTNKMSKVYDSWFNNISNEGRQETELMSSQAEILCELFGEIYKELLPLKLDGMKPPKALNLK